MILLADNSSTPKILCGKGLEDTAHWLRAAGYDVCLPLMPMSDIQLYDIALNENRILIINENQIKQIPQNSKIVLPLNSSLVFEQIKQIGRQLNINWTYRPLSRCMICNNELSPLNINQWIDLPKDIQAQTVTSHGCPECRRIYWAGEEVDRMVYQLESFNNIDW